MKATRFYITELELEHQPYTEDISQGFVDVEFEVIGEPEYIEEEGELESEFSIHIDLLSVSDSTNSEDLEEENVGEIDVSFIGRIEGEYEEFEEHMETWKEDGYRSVDWEFRFHVESGFMSSIISPISSLIDNSFRGVLPQMTLTEPGQSERLEFKIDEEELEFDEIDENSLAESLSKALGQELDKKVKVSVGSDADDEELDGGSEES